MLTLAQAHDQWTAEILPHVIAQYGPDDEPAKSESWNNYTDSLCTDGELSSLLYHYAPAWDDTMPDDDREFVLEQMGVVMTYKRTDTRPDADSWDRNASHYRVSVRRCANRMSTAYSMGAAYTTGPELVDVMDSLLRDSEGVEGADFETWAGDYGYDTDSRRAERTFKACKRQAVSLGRLFSRSNLSDLRELFADY